MCFFKFSHDFDALDEMFTGINASGRITGR